ncbi:MAG: hypothetical protein AAF436_13630 [Myxococcota bacterium]
METNHVAQIRVLGPASPLDAVFGTMLSLLMVAGLVAAQGCAAPSTPPTKDPSAGEGPPHGETTRYVDPQINGHPVAQCVVGQGWGAFAEGRCGPELQRVIASEFCVSQADGLAAVDWKIEKGPSGRHSIWRFDHGTAPQDGYWTHGLATDRFSEIDCAPKP